MQRRTREEFDAMSFREYKIDVWTRLADSWREAVGNATYNQEYVASKITRCDGMAKHFAAVLPA